MVVHCRHCAADRECYTQRKRQRGELRVTNLSETRYQEMKDDLAAALMDSISKTVMA